MQNLSLMIFCLTASHYWNNIDTLTMKTYLSEWQSWLDKSNYQNYYLCWYFVVSVLYFFPAFVYWLRYHLWINQKKQNLNICFIFFCKSVANEIPFSLIFQSSFYLIFSLSMIKKFCLLNTVYLKIKENSCIITMLNKIKEIENVLRR